MSGIIPLFKNDYGIFRKSAQPNKRTDVRSTQRDFTLIEGQIDVDILKKNICDNLGLNSKQSSVQTFVSNLAEADKLLNDENIKNICDTGDTTASETIQKFLKAYTTLVNSINNRTLTEQIVNYGSDGLEKYVNLMDKIICQHTIWLIK